MIPVGIGLDAEEGHRRVAKWISACLVLHNDLHDQNEDWIDIQTTATTGSEDNQVQQLPAERSTDEVTRAGAIAGKIRREVLGNRIAGTSSQQLIVSLIVTSLSESGGPLLEPVVIAIIFINSSSCLACPSA